MKIWKINLCKLVLITAFLFILSYSFPAHADIEKFLSVNSLGNYILKINRKDVEANPKIIQNIANALLSGNSPPISMLVISGFDGHYESLLPLWNVFTATHTLDNLITDNINFKLREIKAINPVRHIVMLYLQIDQLTRQKEKISAKILERSQNSISTTSSEQSLSHKVDLTPYKQEHELTKKIIALHAEIIDLITKSKKLNSPLFPPLPSPVSPLSLSPLPYPSLSVTSSASTINATESNEDTLSSPNSTETINLALPPPITNSLVRNDVLNSQQ